MEIDAVALAGPPREAVLVGEAKWSVEVDGPRLVRDLERRSESLPLRRRRIVQALCGRLRVRDAPPGTLPITVADIFSP